MFAGYHLGQRVGKLAARGGIGQQLCGSCAIPMAIGCCILDHGQHARPLCPLGEEGGQRGVGFIGHRPVRPGNRREPRHYPINLAQPIGKRAPRGFIPRHVEGENLARGRISWRRCGGQPCPALDGGRGDRDCDRPVGILGKANR